MDIPVLGDKPDIAEALARIDAWWNHAVLDRPAILLSAPRSEAVCAMPVSKHESLSERWLDVDFNVAQAAASIANTHWLGEKLPFWMPNLGPDYMAAAYGAELDFGETTTWSVPLVRDWPDIQKARFDPGNTAVTTMMQLTEAALAVGKDKFLVGITDLHPGADLAAALRDPQQLCIDIAMEPDKVAELVRRTFDSFFVCYDQQDKIIKHAGQRLTTTWIPIATPGRYYVPSSDFSCMISTKIFEKFFMPELVAEIEWLDRSIYHLDGPGALRHLEMLLDIDKLDAIQWVYGAGRGPATRWLDVYRQVQAAGKSVLVTFEPQELDDIIAGLRPEGVILDTWAESLEHGNAILDKVRRWK